MFHRSEDGEQSFLEIIIKMHSTVDVFRGGAWSAINQAKQFVSISNFLNLLSLNYEEMLNFIYYQDPIFFNL